MSNQAYPLFFADVGSYLKVIDDKTGLLNINQIFLVVNKFKKNNLKILNKNKKINLTSSETKKVYVTNIEFTKKSSCTGCSIIKCYNGCSAT